MAAMRGLRRRLVPTLWFTRRHLAPLTLGAACVAAVTGRRRAAGPLGIASVALYGVVYARGRRRGRMQTAEHIARMRRLQPEVLQTFYVRCIGSMEAEIAEFPEYDRHKHLDRYRIVADLASRHAADGGTVVDVGCATGLVLDEVHRRRRTVGVGFDLSPHGVRDRARRSDAPVLAQAVVEHIPLRDAAADVVVFSEVIEHLVDAYAGMREVSRITRPGGTLILTTNNGSEMPVVAPYRDPLQWVERLVGLRRPGALAFRNITWHLPINQEVDPLPRERPTYAPHFHFTFSELRDLAADAGFALLSASSFEFPAPQSPMAAWLRTLTDRHRRAGLALSDAVERVSAVLPAVNRMGTHHCLVFRKVAEARPEPRTPWWPAALVEPRAAA